MCSVLWMPFLPLSTSCPCNALAVVSMKIMLNSYTRSILAGDITGNFLGFRMKKILI